MRAPRFLSAPLAALTALALVACAPGGGEVGDSQPKTVSQRSNADQRLGDREHPKLMAFYGGEIADAGLKAYVRELGMKLAAESEQPDAKWTFTVLDSPVVNAFALPGGYVYVTRGLVALANSEAELAGVIGHEIGHVTGAHTAQRQERASIAQLGVFGATILGAIAGLEGQALQTLNQLGGVVGQGYVANFSRKQEFEADSLGIRYLAAAGYDPSAQADFLANMQRWATVQSQIAGRTFDPNRVDFFSTHPATPQRVREAIRLAGLSGVEGAGGRNEGRFLNELRGVDYGDSARQGFVRGNAFLHPELRIAFEAPESFRIVNSSANVTALGPNGARLIFDGDRDPGGDLRNYISQRWAPAIRQNNRTGDLTNVRSLRINGLPAAQGQMPVAVQNGTMLARLTVIRTGDRLYRFVGLEPPRTRGVGAALDRAAKSFRSLSAREARNLRPYRITIHRVQAGDTAERLARRTPFETFAVERFRALNGYDAGQPLRTGDLVKIIRE